MQVHRVGFLSFFLLYIVMYFLRCKYYIADMLYLASI